MQGDRTAVLVEPQGQRGRDVLIPRDGHDPLVVGRHAACLPGRGRHADGPRRPLQRRAEDAFPSGDHDLAVERPAQVLDESLIDPVAQRQRADDEPLQDDRHAADLEIASADAQDREISGPDRGVLLESVTDDRAGREILADAGAVLRPPADRQDAAVAIGHDQEVAPEAAGDLLRLGLDGREQVRPGARPLARLRAVGLHGGAQRGAVGHEGRGAQQLFEPPSLHLEQHLLVLGEGVGQETPGLLAQLETEGQERHSDRQRRQQGAEQDELRRQAGRADPRPGRLTHRRDSPRSAGC